MGTYGAGLKYHIKNNKGVGAKYKPIQIDHAFTKRANLMGQGHLNFEKKRTVLKVKKMRMIAEPILTWNPHPVSWNQIWCTVPLHLGLVSQIKQATDVNKLSWVRKHACLGISAVMRTTPSVILETFLNPPSRIFYNKGKYERKLKWIGNNRNFGEPQLLWKETKNCFN